MATMARHEDENLDAKSKIRTDTVHVNNVEFLPTKLIQAKAQKTRQYAPAYIRFKLGEKNPYIHFTRYRTPSAFRKAGAFLPRSNVRMRVYDYRLSPYMGCSKRCIYCFELVNRNVAKNEVKIKTNTVEHIKKTLPTLSERKAVLVDGYDCEEVEGETKLLRRSLDVLIEYRMPVLVQTKSSLVLRDIDKLEKLNDCTELTTVAFSLTSLEEEHARIFEPYTNAPEERIRAMQRISSRGILTGIVLMPILPFIFDTDDVLERVFSEAASSGCAYIVPEPLRVTGSGPQRNNIFRTIKKHYPELVVKYERLYPRDRYGPMFGTHPKSRAYLFNLFQRVREKGRKYNVPTKFPTVKFKDHRILNQF